MSNREVLERARRTETRVTQIALHLGIPLRADPPRFSIRNGGIAEVELPSPHCSFKEILDSIPDSWDGPVGVFVGDEWFATIDRRRNG